MNRIRFPRLVLFILLIEIFYSCKEDVTIKPPSKLRLAFPKHEYTDWRSQAEYSSKISKGFQVACVFDRFQNIQIGDIVVVKEKVLNGKGDIIGKKILSLGIPIAGKVIEILKDGRVLVEIDLGEEEIEIYGAKKNKFNWLFTEKEVKKISQFEPFDIIEKVSLGSLHGDLMLHYKKITELDSLSLLTKLVISNVESHKFKADKIDKTPISLKENNVNGVFYEFQGDVATSFQFYLTDSSKNFIWGQVLMDFESFVKEGVPTDSDTKSRIMSYIKSDLDVFIENLKWKN